MGSIGIELVQDQRAGSIGIEAGQDSRTGSMKAGQDSRSGSMGMEVGPVPVFRPTVGNCGFWCLW